MPQGRRPSLYLDVEGVVLGDEERVNGTPDGMSTARYAASFLERVTARYRCCWLHPLARGGDPRPVVEYLARQGRPRGARPLEPLLLDAIGAAPYTHARTDALADDFYWITPALTSQETQWLVQHRRRDRWIPCDTRVRATALFDVLDMLAAVEGGGV